MSELIRTRKNKSYTSILLQEVSEQAYKEAMNVYNTIEGAKVIKPSKKAWEKFVKLYSLTLDKVKAGEEYEILGTKYKIVRSLDYNRTDSNGWVPTVRYYNREWEEYQEFGIVSTDNLAVGVHETSFKNMTGKLLYF